MKKTIQETIEKNNKLLDFITPQGIEVKTNYIRTGDQYSKIYLIMNYPSIVEFGWLNSIINIPSVTATIYCQSINNTEFIENISKSLTLANSILATTKDELTRQRAERQVKSTSNIIKSVEQEGAIFMYVTITIKVSACSLEELQKKCNNVENRISAQNCKVRIPSNLMKQVYFQSSPFCFSNEQITSIGKRNMSSYTLFGGHIFDGANITDDTGLEFYLGEDTRGQIIVLDTWKKQGDRVNSNWFICGTSGSGKSFFAKKLLLGNWVRNVSCIAIDPEREYKTLCENCNGYWVDCSGQSQGTNRINPLQIRSILPDEENAKGNTALFFQTINTFFKLYYPEMTTQESALLDQVLEELYKKFHIDWKTDTSKIKNEDFPIMQDLYELLVEKSKVEGSTKEKYEILASIIRKLAIGSDSLLFNGHTTIKDDNKFIVLDTYSMQNSAENVKRAMYFNLLTWAEEISFKNRKEKNIILCDEAWLLIDGKILESLLFLRNLSKRARKYNTSLIVILQSLIDCLSENTKSYSQSLLDNSNYKAFFKMDGANLIQAKELFSFNEGEEQTIYSNVRGQCLLSVGNYRTTARIKAHDFELEYFGNGGGN